MITHHCAQGSTEWSQLRVGIPTASDFDQLVTPLWEIRKGEMPKNYLLRKVAERIMGYPADMGFSNAMEQGQILEKEAIPFLDFQHGMKVERVGFCTTDDGRVGASPDGLLGDDSGVEIKCGLPHTHVAYLLGGECPKEYRAQVQGCMYVTGRASWWFVSYSRFMPSLVIEVKRDPVAQDAIRTALASFLPQLDAATNKIRGMMQQPTR